MALIHDIQNDLLREKADIAPILLKLRLLAAKLGSHPLAEWVKYETEGYPDDMEVPAYRKLGVTYKGSFSGPFGSGIRNAPIPPYLIEKFGGNQWNEFELRQSVAAVDQLVSADTDSSGTLNINASNLILLLQGNVYEGYACNSVEGTLSVAQLREVQHVVRNRILEIVVEIEKLIPLAVHIDVGKGSMGNDDDKAGKVNQIFHQTIHGSMTNVSNTGIIETINIGVKQGDQGSAQQYLVEAGIRDEDAKEFCSILASEIPESAKEPFGTKAKAWVAKSLGKAVDGTWSAGLSVATDVLKKAALSYYGLSPEA